ncbi:MAG: carbohydrate ABC transporter substrate-binding protein [Spirochaetales bacterium]|nr:carbohydrate ABC transporter substrate-binding protein [Spirochaetales bacterium]
MKRIVILTAIVLAALAAGTVVLWTRPIELTVVFPEMDASQRDFILPLVNGFHEKTGGFVHYSYKPVQEMHKQILEEDGKADLYYFVKNYQVRELHESGLLATPKVNFDKSIPNVFFSDTTFFPVSWYPWGIYYSQSYLDDLGIKLPASFEELIDLSSRYHFSIMSRIRWTSSIWLDYLDLKNNGKDFHDQLLSGKISFSDDRVLELFELMSSLVEAGVFLQETQSNDWYDTIHSLEGERALLSLSGSFFYEEADEIFRENLGWMPFPDTDTAVLSTSGFVSPGSSDNQRSIRKFLEYVQSAEGQRIIQEHSDLISIRPDIAGSLGREDLNTAFTFLDTFDSYVPSFERNSHEKLTVPFKNIFHSIIINNENFDLNASIDYLEKIRKTIVE